MNTHVYTDISSAMHNYNKSNSHTFTLIDSLIISAVRSNTYTTDLDIANALICSERTIKRSINKLCTFGLLKKHIAYDNTKTLELHQAALCSFLQKYQEGDI